MREIPILAGSRNVVVEQREPVECGALSPRDLHDVSSSPSGAESAM